MAHRLIDKIRLLATVALAATIALLSGCGDSKTGTFYVLFDASPSSSELIRRDTAEGALSPALGFASSTQSRARFYSMS